MPSTTAIDPAVRFHALADPVRLRVLSLLELTGELCVCEIQQILTLSMSGTSRALRTLERAGWLAMRKDVRWRHYRLAEQDSAWSAVLATALDGARENPDAQADRTRYHELIATGMLCTATGDDATAPETSNSRAQSGATKQA